MEVTIARMKALSYYITVAHYHRANQRIGVDKTLTALC
jgi:hypothetical protein